MHRRKQRIDQNLSHYLFSAFALKNEERRGESLEWFEMINLLYNFESDSHVTQVRANKCGKPRWFMLCYRRIRWLLTLVVHTEWTKTSVARHGLHLLGIDLLSITLNALAYAISNTRTHELAPESWQTGMNLKNTLVVVIEQLHCSPRYSQVSRIWNTYGSGFTRSSLALERSFVAA